MEGGHESNSQEKYLRFFQHFRLLQETKMTLYNFFPGDDIVIVIKFFSECFPHILQPWICMERGF